MLNIISIVIAMILMVIVVAAGMTYLGPMLMDNSARVELSTYLNHGAQIHGALRLYEAENQGLDPDGNGAEQIEALVSGGYLDHAPEGPWGIDATMIYRDIGSQSACYKINAAANVDLTSPTIVADHGCPPCGDTAFSGYPACEMSGEQVITTP